MARPAVIVSIARRILGCAASKQYLPPTNYLGSITNAT